MGLSPLMIQQPKSLNILSKQFFEKEEITKLVGLYPDVDKVLRKIKEFEQRNRFKKSQTQIHFIYIGDGPTDIPALSLTRAYGGYGIVVFNPDKDKGKVKEKLKDMSADSRCDLIAKADFSENSDLFFAIETRCNQILQKYEAEDFSLVSEK